MAKRKYITRIRAEEIAALAGVGVWTVRKDSRCGKVDFRDLGSVVEYVNNRSGRWVKR